MVYHNTSRYFYRKDNGKINYSWYESDNMFMFLGLNMYCYQAISTFYTVRNTMKRPKDMKIIIPRVYFTICILVILVGASFF